MGVPSATRVTDGLGGNGGMGVPSATVGLLTLYLPLELSGSRMMAASSKTAERIANFFMDELSWVHTMRASRATWGQNWKMF